MTPLHAKKIINNDIKSIKDLRPHAIVQPISELPCSAGMIRYAYFVYGEYLVNEGHLTKKVMNNLVTSYSHIHTYFVEDPELINDKYRKFMSDGGKVKGENDFRLSDIETPGEWGMEYSNFLANCQSIYEKS